MANTNEATVYGWTPQQLGATASNTGYAQPGVTQTATTVSTAEQVSAGSPGPVKGNVANILENPGYSSSGISQIPSSQVAGGGGSWGQAAPASYTPANPTATASTTLVMMGLGSTCTYTPSGSGTVLVVITGYGLINTAVTFMTVGARYGTGTAPANGAAVTGTRIGAAADPQIRPNSSGTNNTAGFSFTTVLSLTASTAYWFDIAAATNNASDTAQPVNIAMSFVELP